jgi:hypothetical protein
MNVSAAIADLLREASESGNEQHYTRNALADPPCRILQVIDHYGLS